MDGKERAARLDPIGALFKGTWVHYKKRFKIFVVVGLIPAALFALGDAFVALGGKWPGLGGLFSLAGQVILLWAVLAIIVSLSKDTDAGASYAHSRKFFWPAVWIAILSTVISFGGFFMLIVPAILMGIWFSLANFMLVLQDRRGLNALLQSREYTRDYWWAIFGRALLLGIVMIGCIVVAAIVGLILGAIGGAVIVTVITQLAMYILIVPFAVTYLYSIYKNLTALKPELATKQSSRGKTFFIVSGIVGIVAPIILFIVAASFVALFFARLVANPASFPGVNTLSATSTSGFKMPMTPPPPPPAPNGVY